MENQERIIELKNKIAMNNYIVSGLSLTGGIAGVFIAAKRGNKFWGKVGYFVAGSILVGLAAGIATAPKTVKLVSELQTLEYKEGQENQNIT
jgi:hypothetical protein